MGRPQDEEMGQKETDAKSDEQISVTCPECGAKVKLAVKDAEEKMTARCPKGHEIALVKAL